MKHLHIAAICLLSLALACTKDKSNYEYSEKEIIEINGVQDSYSVITLKDTLRINPELTSNKDTDMEYRWGLYKGQVGVMDTIAYTKNLSHPVKENAGNYILIFYTRNKKTGVIKTKQCGLSVNTRFTRGWYIAKDVDTESDLDLFLTPNNILAEEKLENIYSTVNGSRLTGNITNLSFLSGYYTYNNGPLERTRTLMVSTDKDINAIGIGRLNLIRNKQSLFLGEIPEMGAPNAVILGSSAYYGLAKGQLYSISTNSMNSGLFGNKTRRNSSNADYSLSLFNSSSDATNPVFFDNTSSTFVTLVNAGSTLTEFSDAAGTKMSARNNNKQVLFMALKYIEYQPAPKYSFISKGYAVLQDKTNPALKILSFLEQDEATLKITNDTIPASSKLFNATQYALLYEDENMLYFAADNQIYSRNLNNGFEQLQYAVPAGEEVTFIRHHNYSSEAAYAFNFVIVGTRKNDQYIIRMFKKSSGNLESAPYQVLEGKGIARSLLYIAPAVREDTYPNSF